jgi:hypothetical protein
MMGRDILIVEDYQGGKTAAEISRIHGVSVRRVYQVLEEQNVNKNRNNGARRKIDTPLTKCHEKIGKRVYDFWFDQGLERVQAAGQLGWSVHKLRMVEKGQVNLNLFDLRDIATWMKISLGNLIDGC